MIQTKGELRRLGDALRSQGDSDVFMVAYDQLNLYRQAFSYPMYHVNIRCRQVIARILPDLAEEATIVQRHKRLQSILIKLQRFEQMGLDRMQDIGGVRVILPTIEDVRKFQYHFPGKSKIQLDKTTDYIAHPKADGYRSLHLLLKLQNKRPDIVTFDFLPVELQVRTYLQHCWATAVELLGILDNRSYKTEDQNSPQKEFFRLLSECFALQEVQGLSTADVMRLLSPKVKELVHKEKALHFEKGLERLSLHLEYTIQTKNLKDYSVLILDLNYQTKKTMVYYFDKPEKAIIAAFQKLRDLELQYNEHNTGQAVLIKAEDILKLKKAYPNFFMETRYIIQAYQALLEKAGITQSS